MIDWINIGAECPPNGDEVLFKFLIMDAGSEPAKSIISGWYCDKEGFLFDIGEYQNRYVVTHWALIQDK